MFQAQAAAGRVSDARPSRALPVVLACAGLAAVVAGTFLPWLRSGTAVRNSYAGEAALRHLVDHRGLAVVFAVWPFVGLVCAVAAVLLIAGRTRAGAVLAALVTAAAGSAAVGALAAGATPLVAAAVPGPAVTVSAAGVTLLVSVFLIVRGRTP